jgi:hypothetical protein
MLSGTMMTVGHGTPSSTYPTSWSDCVAVASSHNGVAPVFERRCLGVLQLLQTDGGELADIKVVFEIEVDMRAVVAYLAAPTM